MSKNGKKTWHHELATMAKKQEQRKHRKERRCLREERVEKDDLLKKEYAERHGLENQDVGFLKRVFLDMKDTHSDLPKVRWTMVEKTKEQPEKPYVVIYSNGKKSYFSDPAMAYMKAIVHLKWAIARRNGDKN